MTSRIRIVSGAVLAIALAAAAGCATPPPPAPPETSFTQKMAWILQLEDQRILKAEPPPPPPVAAPPRGRRRAPAVQPVPRASPDLAALVRDVDARIRRRAALAIGRTRLAEGVPPLVATLADADPDVRAMAAFALGLIGSAKAEPAVVPLLSDVVPLVRGRAAEALGLVDAKGAAEAIGRMVAEYARAAPVTAMQPDDETWPAAPEAEAFKLGLFALVRLGAYEPMAAAVAPGGTLVTTWWPVAYALQRVEDKRAAPLLMELLRAPGRSSRAFAARGLGRLKHAPAAAPLVTWLDPAAKTELPLLVSAIVALREIGVQDAGEPLTRLASDPATHPNARLEAVVALGTLRTAGALSLVQDLLSDPWPAMRAAALAAAAAIDEEAFVFVLSGMEPDRHWRVRAALADVLATLRPEVVAGRVRLMLDDEDKRVIPAVLAALTRLKAPDLDKILIGRLDDPDFAVRAAAAMQIGRVKPAEGPAALRQAYQTALPDTAYAAKTAALDALAEYGAAEAGETLRAALADKDWAVRVRAAELLAQLDPAADPQSHIRPVPGTPVTPYDDPQLVAPDYSPHAFIETAHGTIEIELAVLDAPQTCRNFMALARKGFFNGLEVHRVVPNFVVQDGDPRGDGRGGPGYTVRDELNDRPYLRGTVGMALSWADTGGSQFFIAHSPQPHLDARYTAFGHVVSGMEVVDRIQHGDVIQRVRVWDGRGWQ